MKKISIGILTYNHECFIEDCLKSVFALDYENLEIVISDDASKDKTRQIISQFLLKNPTKHHVIFNCNKQNLGLAGNFNKTFREIATGDFLITLGGDDMIKEDYLNEVIEIFQTNQSIYMIDLSAQIIDENNNLILSVKKNNRQNKTFELSDYISLNKISFFAPGRVLRKELVQNFPPISINCPTEDSVLVLRSLLLGKLYRYYRIGVFYRKHSNNLSDITSLKKISNISIIAQYLKDSIFLYEKREISDNTMSQLLSRFDYEYNKRTIVYSNRSVFIKKILIKLMQFKYFLSKKLIY